MLTVSLLTVGSRVLGLVRDSLFSRFAGAGAAASAFNTAFSLPNLMRRLFGEGALTTTMVPLLGVVREREGDDGMFALLNRVLTRMTLGLGILAAFACTSFAATGLAMNHWWPDLPDRYSLTAYYGALLMPFMVFVCLAAGVATALNVLQRFTAPASSQIWMNLVQIGSIIAMGLCWTGGIDGGMVIICAGALAGGATMLVTPWIALRKAGWRFCWDMSPSPHLRTFWVLLLPGLLGAGIFQINTALSRLFAIGTDDSGATLLYLANRLIELPIGVFSVSVATVAYSHMSAAVAAGDRKGFSREYHHGWRLSLIMILPAAFGLVALGEPIIDLLYRHGRFTDADAANLLPVLGLYALGMPFYAMGGFASKGFHVQQDTRTPAKAALVNLLVNTTLSLVFMHFWGIMGLVGANVLTYALYAMGLSIHLRRQSPEIGSESQLIPFAKMLVASIATGLVAWGSWRIALAHTPEIHWLSEHLSQRRIACIAAVAAGVPLGALTYVVLLNALGFPETTEILGGIRRRLARSRK